MDITSIMISLIFRKPCRFSLGFNLENLKNQFENALGGAFELFFKLL